MLLLTIITLFFCGVEGLIGYDCGGPHVNVTTVSLLDVGDCDMKTKDIKTQDVYIQLLQLADFEMTSYFQCKVSVTRVVSYCGMHSHLSAVHNGYAEYLRGVPREQCERMHQEGILPFANQNIIENLKPNSTSTHSVLMAGTLTSDGVCTGSGYTDSYGSWNNVIVQATIKITLKSGFIPVKITSGKVTLRSGTVCDLADGKCLDMDDGYTFWQTIPSTSCDFQHYDVLYEGTAQKTKEKGIPNAPEIFSLTTKETTFALARTTEMKLCGYTLIRTEHPKLFIMETQEGNTFIKTKPISVENLDIFAYVNSKFVYVEKHLKTQISTMYRDIMTQKCELEQQVISNALALARTRPEEFAYVVTKGPGHMAVLAGEAIHIIQCIPAEVTLRVVTECFEELPVTYKKEPFFLQPKTRILQKVGTKHECNNLLPVLYQFEHGWLRFLPKPIDAPEPTILKPHTELTWKYLSAGNLATTGIYSETDLENLREHIMFPAEKPAMVNNIVQGIIGRQTLSDGMSVYHLLDEGTLNKITEGAAKRIWNGFMSFGSVSAGVLAIFVIFRLTKLIFDTLLQGYALHSVYGCGIQLVGAIFTSLTQLLLHLARPNKKDDETQNPEDPKDQEKMIEMPTVQSQPTVSTEPQREQFTYFDLNRRITNV